MTVIFGVAAGYRLLGSVPGGLLGPHRVAGDGTCHGQHPGARQNELLPGNK